MSAIKQSFLRILLVTAQHIGGLGQTHVEDIIAEEQFVSGFCKDLCDFFSILDPPDIEIGCVTIKLHGLFLEA